MNTNDFINSIDNKLYNKIRQSKSDAECRRYLKEHLEAQKIVNAWNSQLNKSRVIPRYFVDIRVGCGAVRDKWHESYNEDYPGLHRDTLDVVEYKHGYRVNGVWNMKDEDVKYLNDLCERLNNEA